MHKDEVSHAFTYVYTSFFKGQWSKVRSDHCEFVGLIVHYDDDSRVEYIEVTPARYAEVTLELFGVDVTDISFEDAVRLLKSKSTRYAEDASGYAFLDLGIDLYSADLESEKAPLDYLGVKRIG